MKCMKVELSVEFMAVFLLDNTTSPLCGVPWEAFPCLLKRLWMDWQWQTSSLFCLVINEF